MIYHVWTFGEDYNKWYFDVRVEVSNDHFTVYDVIVEDDLTLTREAKILDGHTVIELKDGEEKGDFNNIKNDSIEINELGLFAKAIKADGKENINKTEKKRETNEEKLINENTH